MKKLCVKSLFATIILLAMVSCDKEYYENKYGSDAEETELFKYLEGDWQIVHEFAWGYDISYCVSDGVPDLTSGTYNFETGEDNGPVRKSSELYYAIRFDEGLCAILATGCPDDVDLVGKQTPYYVTEDNRLHGSLFYSDVAQYVKVKIIDENTMQFRVDDVGYCKEYECFDNEHDGVILKHNSECELIEYSYNDWHEIKTLKRVRKSVVITPPPPGDWISSLPDDVLLTQLSIPGTHASATYYGLYNDLVSVTQRLKIQTQWDAGIRAFDFTVSNDGMLYHDQAALERSFRDAVDIIKEKLLTKVAPETAIVFVRASDGMSEAQKQQWKDYVGDVVSDLGDIAARWRYKMTLGEAKGRIVFVMGEAYTWDGYNYLMPGACVAKEEDDTYIYSMAGGSAERLIVQDVKGVSHSEKLNAVLAGMAESMTFDNPSVTQNIWMINSLSSYDGGYVKGAVEIVPMVCAFLAGDEVDQISSGAALGRTWVKEEEGPLGIVMMDFASEESEEISSSDLVDYVIQNNSKYTMKTRKD